MEQNEIKNEVATLGNKEISDKLLHNFNQLVVQGQLKFPVGYNVGNQLKLAYLNIKESGVINKVTATSVANSLTEMCLQGLDISKKQCYFIPYGDKLQMFRSYFGDIAVAYSTGLVSDIRATVVHEGDDFEIGIENDLEIVTKHTTSFANKDKDFIGAYAVATLPDGSKRYCVMTRKQINVSWSKAKTHNVQNEFGEEMAKRTVIRRLVKMLFNTANSSDLYIQNVISSYNRTTEKEYDNEPKEKDTKTTIDLPEPSVFDIDIENEDLPFEEQAKEEKADEQQE